MIRASLFTQDPHTKKRNANEKRFRIYGVVAITLALLALLWLLISIFSNGLPAFRQTFVAFPVTLDAASLDKSGNRDVAEMSKVSTIGYGKEIAKALMVHMTQQGIDVAGMDEKELVKMISEESSATLRDLVLADPALIGTTIEFTALASGRIDGYFKGRVTMQTA
jgi:phosphate transport system permease protein